MAGALSLQTVGLLYDIVGVIILGAAFAVRSVRDAANESSLFWRVVPENRRSATEQVDGRIGLALVVAGFLLQLAPDDLSPAWVPACLVGLLMSFMVTYWWGLRSWLIARRVRMLEAIQSDARATEQSSEE